MKSQILVDMQQTWMKMQTNFENRLRFDKVTEISKVVTFLRHSVVHFECTTFSYCFAVLSHVLL